jgi:hypothetical protein
VPTVLRRCPDRRASSRPALSPCPQCGAPDGAVILGRTVRFVSVRCEQCHEHRLIKKPTEKLVALER